MKLKKACCHTYFEPKNLYQMNAVLSIFYLSTKGIDIRVTYGRPYRYGFSPLQFLSGAPHMMPPVSLLCTSFLEHISGRQESAQTDDVIEPMDLDAASSDDESANQNGAFVPKKAELWTPNYEAVKEKRLKKILRQPVLEDEMTISLFGS